MGAPCPIDVVLQQLADAADPARAAAVVATAPAAWRPALSILCAGPEPAEAARRALSLPPAIRGEPFPPALVHVLHQGGYPARLCTLHPAAVAGLAADAPDIPMDPALVAEQLGAAMRHGDPDEAIGRTRTTAYLKLCRLEVAGAPLERVGADLSALAAGFVQALLTMEGLETSVVVFGMGKLGGRELNFFSDIDLLFVHDDALGEDAEAQRAAVIEIHDALRRVVRRLEGVGRWRPVFRVDLRLRPFGRRGPLSMSASAMESYYERHGRAWERQAWLRARPIAGNAVIGARVLANLRPFVYRRTVSASIFEEVAELMARARRESATTGPARGVDLKLDDGAIRTIEFAAQALQLMHAGRNASLRTPSTMQALDVLLAAGLIADREHADLLEAYRFFRRVEHRVQLAEGTQTHTIPADHAARALLAARLDAFVPGRAPLPLAQFDARVQQLRTRASAIAASIAGTTQPVARTPAATILDSGAPAQVRREALAAVGFSDPQEADALLAHLFARDDAALNARGPAREGAERLLTACLDSADPDMALVRFARFCRERPAHYGIWRFFAEPAAPGWDFPRMTAELFGTSEALSVGLIGFPVGRGALPDDTAAVLQAAACNPLEDRHALGPAMEAAPVDPRGLDATLLRFKHQQLVRIGIHDLAQRPNPLLVGRVLSDLADRIVRTVIRDLAAETSWRGGPSFELVVLAVGKYGAQAMDYGSDLDLVFVFSAVRPSHARAGGPAEAGSAATRFAQRLLARLSDRGLGMRLYEIDTRLRPSGRQGLLVTSLAAFTRYHGRALPVWEKLAMLRMRSVAEVTVGPHYAAPTARPEPADHEAAWMPAATPAALAERAEGIVRDHLFRPGTVDLPSIGAAVGDLKRRIERELARESRTHFNAKTGVGGALELELLVAAHQLHTGAHVPAARNRSITAALGALAVAGALPRPLAKTLAANYRFLRLLLNRLRMSHAGGFSDPDRFSANSPKLPTLARRMGLPDAEALILRYRACTAMVRQALVTTLPGATLPTAPD